MQFTFDPTQVSAGIKIFDKGTYEFAIGQPKPFFKDAQNDKSENFGVRYVLTDRASGDKYIQTCYMHNQGGQSFSKGFMMAAYGFARNQENEFNAFCRKEFTEKDYAFSHEDNSAGRYWTEVAGKNIVADMDVQFDAKSGNQQQKVQFRPIE